MTQNHIQFTAANGVPFTVRVVFEGDTYGRERCLTHQDSEPLVEFYDARFKTGGFDPEFGQFVSRYNQSILDGTSEWSMRTPGQGLTLDGGIEEWSVDGESLDKVLAWMSETIDARQGAARRP